MSLIPTSKLRWLRVSKSTWRTPVIKDIDGDSYVLQQGFFDPEEPHVIEWKDIPRETDEDS